MAEQELSINTKAKKRKSSEAISNESDGDENPPNDNTAPLKKLVKLDNGTCGNAGNEIMETIEEQGCVSDINIAEPADKAEEVDAADLVPNSNVIHSDSKSETIDDNRKDVQVSTETTLQVDAKTDENDCVNIVDTCSNSTENEGDIEEKLETDSSNIKGDLKLDHSAMENASNSNEKINREDSNIPIDTPVITISFATKKSYECYSSEFLAYFNKYSEFIIDDNSTDFKINITENENAANLLKEDWRKIDHYDKPKNLGLDKRILSLNKKSVKILKNKEELKVKKELFTLDATPSDCPTLNNNCRYNTNKFGVISNEEAAVADEGAASRKAAASSCFNCGGPHTIRDCTEPKDFAKINRAKQSFKLKFIQTSRYHDDSEQKYAHLRPGTLSAALRAALGLRPCDIPAHVYRMRIYGYPPGWIEDATEAASDISLFGMDGRREEAAAGEVDAGSGGGGGGAGRFNAARMVAYEGFNVVMAEGVKDEFRRNNVPPFSHEHSTDAMLAYIRAMEASATDKTDVRHIDVDIDIDVDKAQEEEPKQVLTPKCEDESSSNDTKSSLGDLESQKLQLLAELNKAINENSPGHENMDDSKLSPLQNTHSGVDNIPHTPTNNLKISEFGTPIIKSASPYSRLPNPDNFSVGVSDVINFENLPNSTGAYEKMTGLISKVRETLKTLQAPSA